VSRFSSASPRSIPDGLLPLRRTLQEATRREQSVLAGGCPRGDVAQWQVPVTLPSSTLHSQVCVA
jgi:hypothetical protein